MEERIPIAAERRRRILDLVLKYGSVSVKQLAEELGAVENTVRRDLDYLHSEGKVVRSHGGASARSEGIPSPPYSQMKDTHLEEKGLIAQAALAFLPQTGAIFINSGVTSNQLALRIPSDTRLSIFTNSPGISIHLAASTEADVNLLGGKIIRETMETDGSSAADVIENLYWDAAFMGIWAAEVERGITSTSPAIAAMERRVIENSKKVIGLCDSWKLGRFAHAKVCGADSLNVLITDSGASSKQIKAFTELGIEVIVASGSMMV